MKLFTDEFFSLHRVNVVTVVSVQSERHRGQDGLSGTKCRKEVPLDRDFHCFPDLDSIIVFSSHWFSCRVYIQTHPHHFHTRNEYHQHLFNYYKGTLKSDTDTNVSKGE